VTAEHRAIVVVDVASFTDPARTAMDQRTVHTGLYETLSAAFDGAGIPWQACYVEDRGDGVMVLVSPDYPKLRLVDQWPTRLMAGLREYNAVHSLEARMQLRAALHAGEVHLDPNGVVGPALNHAFRILDAKPAKLALAESNGILALVASNNFYNDVVRQEPAAVPEAYQRITVSMKQTETIAWLRLPDAPRPLAQAAPPSASAHARPAEISIFDIVDILLELPFMQRMNDRETLIDLLRPEIAGAVQYHPSARMHVVALVHTCARYEHGLAELVEAVRRLDGASAAVARLETVKQKLLPDSATGGNS
jgi:Effector-associated domain 2